MEQTEAHSQELDESPLGLETFSDPLLEDRTDHDTHLPSGLRGEAIRANVKAFLHFGDMIVTSFISNFFLSSCFF